jgi:hypothetical protein
MKSRWPLFCLAFVIIVVIFWSPLTIRLKVFFLSLEANAAAQGAIQTDQSMSVDNIRTGTKLMSLLGARQSHSANVIGWLGTCL